MPKPRPALWGAQDLLPPDPLQAEQLRARHRQFHLRPGVSEAASPSRAASPHNPECSEGGSHALSGLLPRGHSPWPCRSLGTPHRSLRADPAPSRRSGPLSSPHTPRRSLESKEQLPEAGPSPPQSLLRGHSRPDRSPPPVPPRQAFLVSDSAVPDPPVHATPCSCLH